MLFYLSQYLQDQALGTEWESTLSPLRVFRYITFRSAGAAVTALLLSLWLGPWAIEWLKRLRFGQHYEDRAVTAGIEKRGRSKVGTPTMGGLLIVAAIDCSAIAWTRLNELVVLTLLSLVVLAGLGFYDDYKKVTAQSSAGTTSTVKIVVQLTLAVFIGLYLFAHADMRHLLSDVMIPLFKEPVVTNAASLGMLITVCSIVGSSNAVNLTDGLDGLAIGCTVIVTVVFLVLTYIAGNVNFSEYLQVPYVRGAGELTVVCAAVLGASLGFLWFNCHPAQVFMGDTGSLALGGLLGIIAVLIHQPFLLVIAGGVFVAEAASVVLQTGWFKYSRKRYGEGKRLFRMAPLHHHFEKMGWDETQVVTRFYILCVLCAVIAFSTLKIR